jgi:hypothetical protein
MTDVCPDCGARGDEDGLRRCVTCWRVVPITHKARGGNLLTPIPPEFQPWTIMPEELRGVANDR